jgi:DNA-binding response OmpR family regulator
VAPDGDAAVAQFRSGGAELLLLDLMLPGRSGIEVCRAIRALPAAQPIIVMVTARQSEADSVLAFETGADDYVRKPFGIRELLGRVDALIRLSRRTDARGSVGDELLFGDLRIVPSQRRVEVGSVAIALTPMEFDMLAYLAFQSGVVLTRERMLCDVWGYRHSGYARTVDSHVTRVRKKLESAGLGGDVIETVHGKGYRFTLAKATCD